MRLVRATQNRGPGQTGDKEGIMRDDTSAKGPGARIVRLFAGPRPTTDPALDAFAAYWRGKCSGGDVPYRSQIDPRGIEALLADAFIVERIAPGLARLRIAGTHLSDLLGMDVRGMPLSAFFAPPDRDMLADRLVRLFDEPACLRFELSARSGLLTPGISATMLLLPLRSDLGDISRALGCLVTEGTPRRPPQRFAIDSCIATPILPTPAAHRPLPARSGAPARPSKAPTDTAAHPHLRLVPEPQS